jgi:Tol biopolymer transport system component
MNTENIKESLEKMPEIETKYFKSKDGKYIVHKTIITTIKPTNYLKTIVESEPEKIEA